MFFLKKKIRVRIAGIIIENNKMLFIAHKKHNKKYWLLPGGGVEYGESLRDALVREFKEELNIDIAVKDVVLMADSIEPSGKRHIINIFFECTYLGGIYTVAKEKRLAGYGFFTQEEIKEMKIFPPFKNEILSFFKNEKSDIYLGAKWVKL